MGRALSRDPGYLAHLLVLRLPLAHLLVLRLHQARLLALANRGVPGQSGRRPSLPFQKARVAAYPVHQHRLPHLLQLLEKKVEKVPNITMKVPNITMMNRATKREGRRSNCASVLLLNFLSMPMCLFIVDFKAFA